MRIMPIASGSSGNCIYIGSDSTNILLDAGISRKRIVDGLKAINVNLPHIKEQDKISSLMVNIDNLITLHQHNSILVI